MIAGILSCESGEAAAGSLAWLLDVEPTKLIGTLRGIDLEGMYDRDEVEPWKSAWGVLFELVTVRLGHPKREFESVIWFHATRALPGADFAGRGVLPLGQVRDELLDSIARSLGGVEERNARLMLADGEVPEFQYMLKAHDETHYGPYGFLVRDAILRPEAEGNWDYLSIPEIVCDFFRGYERRFGVDLSERVRALLRPAIVWFVCAESARREDVVEHALLYLWSWCTGTEMSGNTCFDGYARPIPPEAVLKVEWLDDA